MAKWRDTITDPALRNIADRLASPTDAVKAIQDLRTDNSQRIKMIDEKATDEDKAKYRKALGIPDDPKGYEIKAPEGMQLNEADNQILEQVLPLAHEAGIPKAAMQNFVDKFLQFSNQTKEQTMKRITDFGVAAEVQLKKEWGQDYETNLTLANRASEVLGGPQFKAFLNETPLATGGMIGDHPAVVKFMATIARRMDEGDLSIGSTAQERTSIQGQIDTLLKQNAPGSAGYTNPEFQKQLQGLYDKLHGNTQLVGRGRAA